MSVQGSEAMLPARHNSSVQAPHAAVDAMTRLPAQTGSRASPCRPLQRRPPAPNPPPLRQRCHQLLPAPLAKYRPACKPVWCPWAAGTAPAPYQQEQPLLAPSLAASVRPLDRITVVPIAGAEVSVREYPELVSDGCLNLGFRLLVPLALATVEFLMKSLSRFDRACEPSRREP